MAADDFEDTELAYPLYRLLEEGFDVELATLDGGEVTGKHGYAFEGDIGIKEARTADYSLLLLPGGKSPENLRIEAPESVELVEKFDEAGKPVAAICHGAQILISADVLEGRRATCYWSIRDDLENAGAEFVDRSVVVDGKMVTSRHPDDLPDFMRETLEVTGGPP